MRLFVLIGSLLVLGLIAALIVPSYVDWNQYRDRFEMEASRVLGQKVVVRGDTKIRLLPQPSITFSDIRVGEDAVGFSVVAKQFKMNVELAPLLKGELVVVDMALNTPRFEIILDDKGKIVWPSTTRKQRVEFSAKEIELNNLVIIDGLIRFRDQRYNREIILKDIDVVASATSLAGPWRGEGSLSYQEERFRLNATTGVWQGKGKQSEGLNGHLRVKLKAQPQSSAYDFEIDGPFKLITYIPSFTGKLKIKRAEKQTNEERVTFRRSNIQQGLPVRFEADLELSSQLALFPAYKLDIGSHNDPYVLTGSGRIELQDDVNFQMRAEGQQINVERLLENNSVQESKDLLSRLHGLQKFLNRIPQTGIDGQLSLFLPAIIAGDTVIRDIGVDLRPIYYQAENGAAGWQLGNLQAQLPGRTELRANGKLKLGKSIGYEGELIVASSQPSGLATWLGADADASIRKLSSIGFSAKTKISEQSATFDELELSIDGRSMTGSLRRDVMLNKRAKISTVLKGDGVNFDQLLALTQMFSGGGEGSSFGGHDLEVDLMADELKIANATASNVTAKITYIESNLSIEQLNFSDLEGTAISVSGKLEDFPSQLIGKLKGRVVSKNPSNFLKLLYQSKPTWEILKTLIDDPTIVENTDLNFAFNGDRAGYTTALKGVAGGSELDFFFKSKGQDFNKPLGQQDIEAKLVLVNETAASLLLQIGIPVVPLDNYGRGALRVVVAGVPDLELKTQAALTLRDGYVSLSGPISTKDTGGKKQLFGVLDIDAEIEDLDSFLLMSGMGLPGFGDGLAGKITGQLSITGNEFRIAGLKTKIGETSASGDIALDIGAQPRPIIKGKLDISPLDMILVSQLAYVGVSANEEGEQKSIFSGLDAVVDLSSNRVLLPARLEDVTHANSKIILRDGDLTFDEIKGDWAGGALTGELAFSQISGAKLLSGQLKIENAIAQKITKIAGFQNFISGKVSANGSFESTANRDQSLLSGLTGSGVARLSDGLISGYNRNAFASVLASADAEGDALATEQTNKLLTQHFAKGALKTEATDIAFSVGSGVFRTNGIKLGDDAVGVVFNGRLDLIKNLVAASSRINFVAGKEIVTGASPEFTINYTGKPGSVTEKLDGSLFETFLALRSSERRQRKFEAQESEILERQRLQRITQLYALSERRQKIIAKETERVDKIKLKIEMLRIKKEKDQKKKAEEQKHRAVEQEKQEKQLAKKKAEAEERVRQRSRKAADRLNEQLELDSLPIIPEKPRLLEEPAL